MKLALPNYFLADLPAEATLTPAMVTEACQTLRRNRERFLQERSTQSIIDLIEGVATEWLQADNPFRQAALAESPDASGFSPATLATGLDNFFRQLTAENLNALVLEELGHASRLDEPVAVRLDHTR